MAAIRLILVILCTVNAVKSAELTCQFVQHRDGYNCEVKSSFNEMVTGVTGHHLVNKTNDDVEVFFSPIRNNITEFPSGACIHFPKLVKFDIYGRSIGHLQRNIFHGCKNVTQVVIMYTSVDEFEEDFFADLPLLEKITVNENALKSLPKKLFKNNLQLKTVDFSYNKLVTITTEFPPSVTYIKLFNNPCVDKSFNGSSELIREIYEKCPDELMVAAKNLSDAMNKFQDLHLTIVRVSSKVDDLETVVEEALDEVDEKVRNVTAKFARTSNQTVQLERDAHNTLLIIESLSSDFQKVMEKVERQAEDAKSMREQYATLISTTFELSAQLKNASMMNDARKYERYEDTVKEVQINTYSNRSFMYVIFVMLLLLICTAIALAIFIKFSRRDKREALLLSDIDN